MPIATRIIAVVMRAMVLSSAGAGSLDPQTQEIPIALPGDVLVRVLACGVCRTDLHILDGELPAPEIPLIPGHEIVGVVDILGDGVTHLTVGDRVGIPWLGYACGECEYCQGGRENLCASARFTGTTWTAATQSSWSPTRRSSSRCPMATAMRRPRRCSAPG